MCDFLEYRNKILHPFVGNLISEEIAFFSQSSNLLLGLQDVGEKFQSTDQNYDKNSYLTYDPSRYIRGRSVLDEQILQGQINTYPLVTREPLTSTSILTAPETLSFQKNLTTQVQQSVPGTVIKSSSNIPLDTTQTQITPSIETTMHFQTPITTTQNIQGPLTTTQNYQNIPVQTTPQDYNIISQALIQKGYTHDEKIKVEDEENEFSDEEPIVHQVNPSLVLHTLSSEMGNLNLNQSQQTMTTQQTNLISNLPKTELLHQPLNFTQSSMSTGIINPNLATNTTTKMNINLKDINAHPYSQ
jgi:hypothetical protein